MRLRRHLFAGAGLLLAACSGGGAGFVPSPIADGGGDGGASRDLVVPPGDLGGREADLVAPSPPDLAVPPPDLAVPPPDLAVAVDLAPRLDLALSCLAGHYSGRAMVMALANVEGPVELDVAAVQGGSAQVTGTISASNLAGTMASADVAGTLDCNGQRFTGMLKNGKATLMGIMLPFTGTIDADYRPAPAGFVNGTIVTMGVMGQGTWSADRK